jgi:hypothetical protein
LSLPNFSSSSLIWRWQEADDMITEVAQIEIKPGTEKDYEAAIAKA